MPKDERFVYTGVAASELEEQQMVSAPELRLPRDTPPAYLPPTQAQIMHAAALAHGLPDIHGFYGYDFEEHEFIRLPESKVKRVAVPRAPDPELDAEQLEALEREAYETPDAEELEDAELDAALRESHDDGLGDLMDE